MLNLALAVVLGAGGGAGAEAGFQVYPVKGVFFAPAASAALIHPAFRAAIDASAGAHFEQKFRQSFPEAATLLDDSNKRRTFVVSLQVSRASVYTVPKRDGVMDVYAPMTASLYFTNVLSGEVLFALARTDIPVKTVLADRDVSGHAVAHDLFKQFFPELIDELVDEARKRFHPTVITVTVRGTWKGLAILDAGADRGLYPGDSLIDATGDALRVVSVGPAFSFASVDLGTFAVGAQFSRQTNQTLAELRKPRALVFVEEAPKDLPGETLGQLFGDSLGDASPVSLLPVNHTFAAVLHAVAAGAQITQQELREREWPDLFVRLHIVDPTLFETAGGRGTQRRRISEGLAYLEVQDRSGRVLFATQGRDRIQDEILAGVTFNAVDRREIAVKNTLLDLAKKLTSGLKLRAATLRITAVVGDEVTLADPSGLLMSGASLRVVHGIGRVGGIGGEVQAPTWDLEVFENQDGFARARLVLPVVAGAPRPSPGDVAVVEGVAGSPTRHRIGPCGEAEKLGPIEVSGYAPLAFNLFAGGFAGNVYAPGLSNLASTLVSEGSGFKKDLPLREPAVDLCVQPVYRIEPKDRVCSDDGCAETDLVRLTYRLRQGGLTGEVLDKKGLETNMRGTALPSSTPAEDVAASQRIDLLDEVLSLAPKVAASFSATNL